MDIKSVAKLKAEKLELELAKNELLKERSKLDLQILDITTKTNIISLNYGNIISLRVKMLNNMFSKKFKKEIQLNDDSIIHFNGENRKMTVEKIKNAVNIFADNTRIMHTFKIFGIRENRNFCIEIERNIINSGITCDISLYLQHKVKKAFKLKYCDDTVELKMENTKIILEKIELHFCTDTFNKFIFPTNEYMFKLYQKSKKFIEETPENIFHICRLIIWAQKTGDGYFGLLPKDLLIYFCKKYISVELFFG